MNQKPVVPYTSQFAMLLGFTGASFIIGALLLGWVAADILKVPSSKIADALIKPENVQFSRIANTLFAFVSFFIPAWVVAAISYKKSFSALGFNTAISIKQVAIVGAISFGALFLNGSFAAINEMIPMPASFLAEARKLEASYQKTMLAMANMKQLSDLFIGLLVIAVAPAIFEEVLFRAGLQRILFGLTKHAAISIIIASILFSAIHGSYFGFLPRLALGIVLGLIYYLTNNLWLAILMHFLNNAVVVIQLYVYNQMGKPIKEAMEESMPIWYGIFGLLIVIPAFIYLTKESRQRLATQAVTLDNESMD